MKKKWLYLIETLGFLLLFCFLFIRMDNVFSQKLRTEHPIKNFFRQKDDSMDVLILGSSHAYYGLYPMELWNERGIAAYNLGTPQQSLGCTYHLLKQALKEQTPNVVVLDAYYTFLDKTVINDARLRTVSDPLPLGKEKKELIEEMDTIDPINTYYLPFMKYHGRWKLLEKSDFEPQNSFCKGAVVRSGISPQNVPEAVTEAQDIPPVAQEYLDKIISLCREKNIGLVMTELPFTKKKTKNYERKRKVLNRTEQYAREQGIPFLNFYDLADEVGLDFQTDMLEPQHLNLYGAAKVSKYLAVYLSEEFQLPDRRGTSGYEQWRGEADRFRQFVLSQELPEIRDTVKYMEALQTGNYTIVVQRSQNAGAAVSEQCLSALQSAGFMSEWDSMSDGSYLGILRNGSISYETYEPNQEYQMYEGLDYIAVGTAEPPYIKVNGQNYQLRSDALNLLVYDPVSEKVVDFRKLLSDGTFK